MSTKYLNLTYKELMELAPRDKPFQMVVQSNPFGEGTKQTLWAYMLDNYYLTTLLLRQSNLNGIDYAYNSAWRDDYKGTFDLITHYLDDTTLERFQVGDEVEVLDKLCTCSVDVIGKTFTIIDKVLESNYSINYVLNISNTKLTYLSVPQNCLRKVVTKEGQGTDKLSILKSPEPKTITIGDKVFEVSEELTNALKDLKPIK